MPAIDSLAALCLVLLAAAAVVSGLDDLVLDLWLAGNWLRRRLGISTCLPTDLPAGESEQKIAVFLPLWREHSVVGRMLEHNLAGIRYANYDFFVGAYPNDPETLEAVRQAGARFANVRLAIVPHDGPTSKADCLNWIYQSMLAHEEACGVRFAVIVTHDAEDVIHPDSLAWINHLSKDYDMVQVPVLPLATPAGELTHGVYCDEFAEFQLKDVPARLALGGFLPSNGVGTGYRRRALEKLAEANRNCVFDPTCLTEDYDCGLRLHQLGFSQVFLPVRLLGRKPMATREFFPRSFLQAVRQRTRWVTGICLQGWERHGWKGKMTIRYWLWRDRKGLLGNPLSLLGNLLFCCWMAAWPWRLPGGGAPAVKALLLAPGLRWLFAAALASQALRIAVRTAASAHIYGWAFAAGAPLRIIWANWLNAAATIVALVRYARTRLARQAEVWLKTDHTFPVLEFCPEACARRELHPAQVRRQATRALPLRLARRWRVLPFRIAAGSLYLATPEPPAEELQSVLRRHTRLAVRFQLVSRENFALLERKFH